MKTTVKKLVLVALMFGTLITNANESEKTNTTSVKRVKVEFETVKKGHVLSIKDEEGTVLYTSKIEKNGTYSRVFDLSKLKQGNYTTELDKDYEIIVKSFSVNEGKVKFNTVKTIFKPVIRTENNLVLISKIDFDKEPLSVVIFYKDDTILSETIKDSKTLLNRVYKVSEEEKGEYRVVINSNNRTYTKEFKI